MKDETFTSGPPDGGDLRLDRELRELGHFSPSLLFSDRVMAHVRRPTPAWVRGIERGRQWIAGPRRLWYLSGGLAGASALSTAGAVTLVVRFWAEIVSSVTWFAQVGTLLLLQSLLDAVLGAAPWIYQVVAFVAQYAAAVAAAGLGLSLVSVACGWGLYRLMRRYPVQRFAYVS